MSKQTVRFNTVKWLSGNSTDDWKTFEVNTQEHGTIEVSVAPASNGYSQIGINEGEFYKIGTTKRGTWMVYGRGDASEAGSPSPQAGNTSGGASNKPQGKAPAASYDHPGAYFPAIFEGLCALHSTHFSMLQTEQEREDYAKTLVVMAVAHATDAWKKCQYVALSSRS